MKTLITILTFCLCSLNALSNNKFYAWRGMLNNEISFRLDLEENDEGHVIGETTYYRKNGKIATIKIFGESLDMEDEDKTYHTLILPEFNKTKICGVFNIVLENGHFKAGRWVYKNKELPITEVESVSLSTHGHSFINPVSVTNAQGYYEFSYESDNESMPEYGGTAQIITRGDNIGWSMSQVTPNIADASGRNSDTWGNRFVFRISNACYCTYTYKECLYVKRLDPETGPCEDFGDNADITGVYIATEKSLEGDILSTFDEEDEFSKTLPCTVFELNDAWKESVNGEETYPDKVLTIDLDNDGKMEIIAQYDHTFSELYEVSEDKVAVFSCNDGELQNIATASGSEEIMSIFENVVIIDKDYWTQYFGISNSSASYNITRIRENKKADYSINLKTIKEKDVYKHYLRKDIDKKATPVKRLKGWRTVPGSIERNATAPRG